MDTNLSIYLNFARSFNAMCHEVHQLAVSKGWWDQPRSIVSLINLAHSETCEGIEALRNPGPSDKIPEFLGIEEELADTLIRIGDMLAYLDIDLGARLVFPYYDTEYEELVEQVAMADVEFTEFAKHYGAWLNTVDLWRYTIDDKRASRTKEIDDLDLVSELLSTAGRVQDSIGTPVLFEMSLKHWILRIIGIGQQKKWRIAEALVAKHEHNKGRSIRHGNMVEESPMIQDITGEEQ